MIPTETAPAHSAWQRTDTVGTELVFLDAAEGTAGWAVRRLGLTSHGGPVSAPTARVLRPSLAIEVGISTYQLIGPRRLRITGDEPAAVFDLDDSGTVLFQPGRVRLVR